MQVCEFVWTLSSWCDRYKTFLFFANTPFKGNGVIIILKFYRNYQQNF